MWLLGGILRRRVRPSRALLALVFALADVLIVVFLAAGSLGGSCSDRESMIIDHIAQYPGAPATFDYESSTGSCAASLEVAASPEDVLAHYRGELESDGWTVAIEDVPTESGGEPVISKTTVSEPWKRFIHDRA
jgi:hypothetical protein